MPLLNPFNVHKATAFLLWHKRTCALAHIVLTFPSILLSIAHATYGSKECVLPREGYCSNAPRKSSGRLLNQCSVGFSAFLSQGKCLLSVASRQANQCCQFQCLLVGKTVLALWRQATRQQLHMQLHQRGQHQGEHVRDVSTATATYSPKPTQRAIHLLTGLVCFASTCARPTTGRHCTLLEGSALLCDASGQFLQGQQRMLLQQHQQQRKQRHQQQHSCCKHKPSFTGRRLYL